MSQSVIFATPTRGNVAIEYLTSMQSTMRLLGARQIPFGFINALGNPYIGLARDQMVAAFLKSGAENLFFIDDDLGWPAEAVVSFLERPELIVAGVYPLKQEETEFPCNLARHTASRKGLLRAEVVPVGFCRIKLGALIKMIERVPYYREAGASVSSTDTLYELFPVGPRNGVFMGEDVAFVRNATDAGIEVWVDPSVEFTHRGVGVWHGSFAHYLENKDMQ